LLPGSVFWISAPKFSGLLASGAAARATRGTVGNTSASSRFFAKVSAVELLQCGPRDAHRVVVGRLRIDRAVRRGELARDHEGLEGALDVGARDACGELRDVDAGAVLREVRDHVVVRLVQREREADGAVEVHELGISTSTSVTPAVRSLASAASVAARVSASRLA
jgi:hypothetical protein